MTVKQILDFFALNNQTIEVDLMYDDGSNAFLGLVYDYMGERKVSESAANEFGNREVVMTETFTDDDGLITFDLYIQKQID